MTVAAGIAAPSSAELAILRSVLYASLFDYPLTLAELRHALVLCELGDAAILRAYQASPELQGLLEYRDGFFYPRGRSTLMAVRRQRETRSLAFLDANRGLLKVICALPFVRLVALSGSIASLNADRDADLDLFIITKGRRAWSVTVALVLLARLGRRRRVVCANFVLADSQLALEPGQQDLFSANQIIHLRPLAGPGAYAAFLAANPFVARFYPNFRPADPGAFPFRTGAWRRRATAAIEALLAWPSLVVEAGCRRAYGWHLRRRATGWRSPEQVKIGPDCLKLHTRSHRTSILDRFDRLCRRALRQGFGVDEAGEPAAPQRAVNS